MPVHLLPVGRQPRRHSGVVGPRDCSRQCETGGDNGDGSVVQQCHAPASGVEQLQCYCTTALCGAGMLDAGAAVAAASGPVARITVLTAAPTAGTAVSFKGDDSLAASGTSIAGYA